MALTHIQQDRIMPCKNQVFREIPKLSDQNLRSEYISFLATSRLLQIDHVRELQKMNIIDFNQFIEQISNVNIRRLILEICKSV